MGATNTTLCSALIDGFPPTVIVTRQKMRCCLPDKKLWYQLTRYGDTCSSVVTYLEFAWQFVIFSSSRGIKEALEGL